MLFRGSAKIEPSVLGCLLLVRKLLFGSADTLALIPMHSVTNISKIPLFLEIVLQRRKREERNRGERAGETVTSSHTSSCLLREIIR